MPLILRGTGVALGSAIAGTPSSSSFPAPTSACSNPTGPTPARRTKADHVRPDRGAAPHCWRPSIRSRSFVGGAGSLPSTKNRSRASPDAMLLRNGPRRNGQNVHNDHRGNSGAFFRISCPGPPKPVRVGGTAAAAAAAAAAAVDTAAVMPSDRRTARGATMRIRKRKVRLLRPLEVTKGTLRGHADASGGGFGPRRGGGVGVALRVRLGVVGSVAAGTKDETGRVVVDPVVAAAAAPASAGRLRRRAETARVGVTTHLLCQKPRSHATCDTCRSTTNKQISNT
jgi:hypothetical protein